MGLSVLDINPLEHLTSDIAKSQFNYESILRGLVNWDNSKDDYVTIRLATTSEPYFKDIQLHTRYYHMKASNSKISEKILKPGKFAFNSRYQMSCSVDDIVDLRFTAVDLGDVENWGVYNDVTLYNEVEQTPYEPYVGYYSILQKTTFDESLVAGTYIKYSYLDQGVGAVMLCKIIRDVDRGEAIIIDGNNNNAVPLVYVLDNASNGIIPSSCIQPEAPMFIEYGNVVYIRDENVTLNIQKKITKAESGYVPYATVYENRPHEYGDYVYYRGEFFVYTNETSSSVAPFEEATVTPQGVVRKYNDEYWVSVLLQPTGYRVSGSRTVRMSVNTDINGFVLKNESETTVSNEKTDIGVVGSIKIIGEPSKEHSGLDIFSTSNYAEWPNKTSKWVSGASYTTDSSKDAYSLQTYSAVMMFNHADSTVKQRNIINYDGPDLDQGLCIMLPCEVEVEENGYSVVKTPTDGMMFDFILNIWPNHAYDNRTYNDLIINKSQVYVYNVKNWSDYKANGMGVSTVTPIAKFSMARLLNFYVHDENVGVPDRPVVYKASFIYSATENRWKTYDYYQFPDHILLSPKGFVDPMSKDAYAVQSAGFPLFANPFSDYDLSPIHVSDGYLNQIQEDPRDQ